MSNTKARSEAAVLVAVVFLLGVLLGGVATHLLRISTLPILIVPPPDSPRTSRKPASITAQFPSPESVKPLRNHS